MNKLVIIIVIVVLIGIGAWLGVSKKPGGPNNSGTNSYSSNSASTQSQTGANLGNASNSQPSATNAVSIENFSFSPASITVKKGTTVIWSNNDSTTHTVTENDGKTGPNSGDLAPGKTYSFNFNQTGTFNYHCSIHPEMTASVTVTD